MNKKENKILFEVATDIKALKKQREESAIWLQKSLDRLEAHLVILNGTTTKHSIGIAVNKGSIRRLWWLFGIFSTGVLALVLWVMNIF